MKNILIAILLILCLIASLTGCGCSGQDSSSEKKEKARTEKEENKDSYLEDEQYDEGTAKNSKSSEDKEKGSGFISDLKELFEGDGSEAEGGSEKSENSGRDEGTSGDPDSESTDPGNDSYSINDINDFEAANIIIKALQQGNMNAILELCAVDEFIDSKYVIIDAIRCAEGNHPLIDYEYPKYSDTTKSMLHIMYEASYAGSIFGCLFEMVNGSEKEDFMAADFENKYHHVSEQAVRFEEALEKFDFSRIRVEALAQISVQTAVEDGWIGEEYASMMEIFPMLKEFEAAGTYASEGSVYVAVVSYDDKIYTVTIPLMHYEEGWRIQGVGPFSGMFQSIVINATDGSAEEAVLLLEKYVKSEFGTEYEPHDCYEEAGKAYSSEEGAAEAAFELIQSGNLTDPEGSKTLQDLSFSKSYLAKADVYDWFDWKEKPTPYNYNAVFSIGAYIQNSQGPFPTAAEGFSELSEKILIGSGSVSAAILWRRANMIALNLLNDSLDDYGITDTGYANGWVNFMIFGDSEQTRPPGNLSVEQRTAYSENYPLNLPAVYQEKLEEVLSIMTDPKSMEKLEDPIPESCVNQYQNMTDDFNVYRISLVNDFSYNLLISECDGAYRLAGFDFQLESADYSGEPAAAADDEN